MKNSNKKIPMNNNHKLKVNRIMSLRWCCQRNKNKKLSIRVRTRNKL